MKVTTDILVIVLAFAVATASGCSDNRGATRNPRDTAAVEAELVKKWGKGLDELPTAKVVLISANNESITNEFTWAFQVDYALTHGWRVNVEWIEVGGGATGIVRYLRNVYSHAQTADVDVVWGGGQIEFQKLANDGLLSPMHLPAETLSAIPAVSGGIRMRDPNDLWCGSAVSGVGFLYNRSLLKSASVAPPKTWDDLARPDCFGLICLADPSQSGSAALAYAMIVQSGKDWPAGWAKLLAILANAKRIVDSAGAAANGPAMGEAPIATCIDFYGAMRVAEAPDELKYVSPKGQTAFSPDPIAILKNPPHPELAQAFVQFVLSKKGQALWALRVGEPDGPIRSPLARQPIRTDVYRIYVGKFSPWIINPYTADNQMDLDSKMLSVSFGVIRALVKTAAVDNLAYLKAARVKLIESDFPPALLADFNRLPPDVATRQAVAEAARKLRDKAQAEQITSQWQQFFRDKYRRVAAGENTGLAEPMKNDECHQCQKPPATGREPFRRSRHCRALFSRGIDGICGIGNSRSLASARHRGLAVNQRIAQ